MNFIISQGGCSSWAIMEWAGTSFPVMIDGFEYNAHGRNSDYISFLQNSRPNDKKIYYEEGDEIVIEPSHGAKAELRVSEVGSIRSIKVTEPGEGFKEMPNVYIKSKRGVRSKLLPQLGVNRMSAEAVREPSLADKIIQVVDTVGGLA